MLKTTKREKLYPITTSEMKTNLNEMIASKSNISLLKKLRKAKGYTLIDLSELTGLSPSYISRLEAGDRRFNSDLLRKLSAVLGCSEYDLLKNTEDKSVEREITYVPTKDLPVYNVVSASAVPGSKSEFPLISFDEIDKTIFRLPQLIGVKSAFAFFVIDNLNAPKYKIGDLVFVNTEKVLKENSAVVIITKKYEIIVSKIIKWNDDVFHFSFFDNVKNFSYNKSEVLAVYSILGSFESSI